MKKNELININKERIGVSEVNAVDARELHIFLESKREFSTWIKNRISEYGFIENLDFLTILSKNPNKGRPQVNYTLSVDMAKEISMVERNEKGRQARKYFIECERRVKTNTPKILSKTEALLQTVEILAEQEMKIKTLEENTEKVNEAIEKIKHKFETNGCEPGFIPQSEAHIIYGKAVSFGTFKIIIKRFKHPVKKYIFKSKEGYSIPATSVKEEGLEEIISKFVSESYRATPQYHEHPALKGKRFRVFEAVQ
ncbi:MAG: hypothetical protein GY714_03780 [Desulfobacterales bacterium]|nr:hypothetical protein [Desulfobacterales bacterium]